MKKRPVYVEDSIGDLVLFDSIAKAAEFIGVNESSIRRAITRSGIINNRYKVSYKDIPTKIIDARSIILNKKIDSVNKSYVSTHLVLPDMHIPFLDQVTVQRILRMMKDIKIDGVHILGDFLDCTALSSHDLGKVNKGVPLSQEYEIGNMYLDYFQQATHKDTIFSYIIGNHEERANRIIKMHEYNKLGSVLIPPVKALHLIDRGFTVAEDYPNGVIKVGDIELIHGMYVSANNARKHLDKVRGNVMYGHTHAFTDYTENGITAYNIGHLVNINAPIFSYTDRFAKMNWQSGFALIRIVDDKTFVEKIKVVNSHFIVNGLYY